MKNRSILIPLVFVLLLLVASVVYFATFTRVSVVQDETWKYTMPKGSMFRLRMNLLKDGCRLKVVTIAQEDLTDEITVLSEFSKLDTGGTVIASPMVSAAVQYYNIKVKKELLSTHSIGIGMVEDYFDEALISNTYSAWADVAKKVVSENKKVALIFDDSSITEARVIYDLFSEDEVLKYNIEDYGSLYVEEILREIEKEGIDLIICPHVEKMDSFFESKDSHLWITDYRFSQVVPKENLRGVIAPNLYTSMKTGNLVYEYRSFK